MNVYTLSGRRHQEAVFDLHPPPPPPPPLRRSPCAHSVLLLFCPFSRTCVTARSQIVPRVWSRCTTTVPFVRVNDGLPDCPLVAIIYIPEHHGYAALYPVANVYVRPNGGRASVRFRRAPRVLSACDLYWPNYLKIIRNYLL